MALPNAGRITLPRSQHLNGTVDFELVDYIVPMGSRRWARGGARASARSRAPAGLGPSGDAERGEVSGSTCPYTIPSRSLVMP
jgi:hypothetical protein